MFGTYFLYTATPYTTIENVLSKRFDKLNIHIGKIECYFFYIFANKAYKPCNHENNRHFIVSFILPAHACKENG